MTRRDWLLFLGLMLVVTVLALPILTYPLGRDQGEFATIGRGLLQGKIPYVDLWNPKPPAIFYVYALAMTLYGQTTAALRALDLLLVPLLSAALYWLGFHLRGRRVALFAAVIFPAFYLTETFWTLTQNDGIAMLPMTLAVLLLFLTVRAARVLAQAAVGLWRGRYAGHQRLVQVSLRPDGSGDRAGLFHADPPGRDAAASARYARRRRLLRTGRAAGDRGRPALSEVARRAGRDDPQR